MLALTHTQPQTVGETGLLIIYIYINNVFFSFFRILFFLIFARAQSECDNIDNIMGEQFEPKLMKS